MAKFWCWFLGHKWRMPTEWFFENTDVKYTFYCERCGKATGTFEHK